LGNFILITTTLSDLVLMSGLLLLAWASGVPAPALLWMAAMFCIIALDFRILLAVAAAALTPVMIYLLPQVELVGSDFFTNYGPRAAAALQPVFSPPVVNFAIFVLGLLGIVVLVQFAIMVYRRNRGRDPLEHRLASLTASEDVVEDLREAELSLSFSDRVLMPFAQRVWRLLSSLNPIKPEQLKGLIEMSGRSISPTGIHTRRILWVISIILALLFGDLYKFIPATAFTLALIPVAALGGYLLPTLQLHAWRVERQRQFKRDLPAAIDFMLIGVEAGLGLDAAMHKVYQQFRSPVGLNFGRIWSEVQLGKQRRDALRDSTTRVDLPEYNAFIAAIIQAEQLGASMEKIIRVHPYQLMNSSLNSISQGTTVSNFLLNFVVNVLLAPSIIALFLAPIIGQLLN
jgi:tight adherence protein C